MNALRRIYQSIYLMFDRLLIGAIRAETPFDAETEFALPHQPGCNILVLRHEGERQSKSLMWGGTMLYLSPNDLHCPNLDLDPIRFHVVIAETGIVESTDREELLSIYRHLAPRAEWIDAPRGSL
jgi:hypothetical protein